PVLPVLDAVEHPVGRDGLAVGPLADQDAAEVVAGLRVERLEESTEIAFFVDEIGQLRTPSLITVPRGATLPDVRRQGGHRWDHVQARSLGWPWVHPG